MTDDWHPGEPPASRALPESGRPADGGAFPRGGESASPAGGLASFAGWSGSGAASGAPETGVCHSSSPEETLAHARSLAPRFARSLVLLEGPLGAGKTLWAKGFAAGLGLQRPVYSPTFTLMNQYAEGDRSLFHLDLYRIGSLEELHDIGLFELLDAGLPCLVEWPERVPQLAALPHLHVALAYAGEAGGADAGPRCAGAEDRRRGGEGEARTGEGPTGSGLAPDGSSPLGPASPLPPPAGRVITWTWRPRGG